MLKASCHCGAVQIELARKPRSVTQCTCSICHRYGAQWAYCTRKTATVSCEPDAVTAYRWGDKSLEFFHCTTCGCLTHYESTRKDDDSRIAVNARMLARSDLADVRVRTFDGADTWKYLDDQAYRGASRGRAGSAAPVDLNQVTLPCTDYDASVRFYKTLGLTLIVDSPPRYARFETAAGTTLSIHAVSEPAVTSEAVIYFEVENVDLEVRRLQHLGLVFESQAADTDWLWREAYVRDPAGNRLCLYHAGDNRRFPPWRVT